MDRKSGIVLLAIITIAATAATIGYIKKQDKEQQAILLACFGGARACMTLYNQKALIRLQQLFQSDDQCEQCTTNNAMSLYQKIIPATPRLSNALLRLSKIYATLGNHDQALAAYKSSIVINPSNSDPLILPSTDLQKTAEKSVASTTALCNDYGFAPTYI